MDITYVSAFYNIYNEPRGHDEPGEQYLEHFISFLKYGYHTILFLDPQMQGWAQVLAKYTNLTIVSDVEFASLTENKHQTLPAVRNEKKDTYEYLVLMNSKTSFVKKAARIAKTDNLAWIDFAISKLLKDPASAYKRLKNITIPANKILIPGCLEPGPVNLNNVNWRFCGSLFFANKTTAEQFHSLAEVTLAKQTILSWEVNIWALIEQNSPNLFQWYKGDHNDTIFSCPVSGEKKVIVTIMIKNEQSIIKRCITNALSIADAICISDTGSTDKTLEILKEFLPTLPVPAKLCNHIWQDFGHNRTLSFNESQTYCEELGWNPELVYALVLDADMNFVQTPAFDKSQLITNGYRIKQKSGTLEYYNTRFMKIAYPWKCLGVTHEYWDGSDTAALETIYINDIGDGGCKSDKFTRDERLLKKGLEDDPTNCRYMFYLGQTLKDLKKLPESIEMYKKRMTAGGWYEEIWYSMYIVGKLYHELGNLVEMEYWLNRAYELNKNRAENIYYLTKTFRELGQNYKAWHYLEIGSQIKQSSELLFVETEVYEHLFDYERTILNYYIKPHEKIQSLSHLIKYYNKKGGHCYSNLQFYVQPLKKKLPPRLFNFKHQGDFVPTSTSILRQPNDTYRLNVRYVNYRIQHDGSYLMMKDGVLSRDNAVKTRNFTVLVDSEFQPLTELTEMITDFPPVHQVHIEGLEDVRLYEDNNEIKWVGTSMEFSYDGRIRQVMGTYNLEENKLQKPTSLIPPVQSDCEKNWIPLGNDEFIYGWKPYTVGKIVNAKLTPTFVQETPRYFEHVRGSSNIVEYKESLWLLTHVVMYISPRKYYHQLMRLNKQTRKIEAYSLPFFFQTNHIEYCLGIEIRNETLVAIVSQNDATPILVSALLSDLTFVPFS